MSIILSMAVIIVAIALLFGSSINQRRNIDRYINARIEDGYNRKANPELEEQYLKEGFYAFSQSVKLEDKNLFFPEKYEFFKTNPEARTTWIMSVAQERVIDAGYAPKAYASSFSLKLHSNYYLYRLMGWAARELEFNKNSINS